MASSTTAKAPLGLMAKFKAYHSKHPIIVGYGVLCSISAVFWIRSEYITDPRMQCVTKYKRSYIVLRPDDPHVKMIKTGPIGLDY